MADNYLERRQEELAQRTKKIVRKTLSLDTLLRRNRSYRGYNPQRKVTETELKDMVAVTTLVASGMNRQVLRYRLVLSDEAPLVWPLITLGAALKEEHLPKPGTEPGAFIVVCSVAPEDRVVDMDLGIAGQSILLKATEMGLGGIFILNFRKEALKQALQLPMDPLAVIAIGQPAEKVFLKPVEEGPLAYYRKDGAHIVPKLSLDAVLIP